jgi:hypothetical protein
MFSKLLSFLLLVIFISILLVSCDNPTKAKDQCAIPVLDPSGGNYPNEQTVTMTCATNEATIRYTTDGSEPTTISTMYTDPIQVLSSITIKAQAFKSGYTNSLVATENYDIEIQTVTAPDLTPAGGTYGTPQTVSITCVTPGAQIRFTTDGTNPNSASTVYTIPLDISSTTTIKAQAYKNGWNDSQIVAALYSIQIVANPVLNPGSGVYSSVQSVSINCATNGSTINYTTDGTNPNFASPVYVSPINVTTTTTIKAKATKIGWGDSEIMSGSYTIQIVANPNISPASGTYTSFQTVSITSETDGATIRYTTDGSTPTLESVIYSNPINVNSTTTIKAKAYKSNWGDSQISTALITIQIVSDPLFNPGGGTFNEAQNVSLSCPTPGTTIRYTTNGSNPTPSSTVYATPISITVPTTIKAQAFKTGWGNSQVTSADYMIQSVATPVITPSGGTFNSAQTVTMDCLTQGATIRYTTNGNDPDASSTAYTAPFILSSTATIKAKAFRNGMTSSNLSTAAFVINIPIPSNFVLVPGGTFNNGTSNVTVSSIYLDKFEITQSEFYSIMEYLPSYDAGVGSSHPVYSSTWYNAIEYCNKRSVLEGLSPCYKYANYGMNVDNWPDGWDSSQDNHTNMTCNWGANGYRLPTEAEWIWAAKGGPGLPDYMYSGSDNISSVAWFAVTANDGTHIVATKIPNELGIYDMTGNVWEWCWDIFEPYPQEDLVNPHGAETGIYRILHGGAWQATADACATSHRSYGPTTNSGTWIGFRICRNVR